MPASSRMLFSSLTLALIMLSLCMSAQAGTSPSWEHYKRLFVTADGRVIDYGQDQSSTSESQGYGMLLSVFYDDRKVFESIWGWSKANLAVRKDGLMAWLWGKRPTGKWEVMDYNNATDGDTLMALSLLKAAKQWGNPGYREDAGRLIRSMREKLAVNHNGMTLLLPGYYGFSGGSSITVNPSYQIFSAFRMFAEVDSKVFWEELYDNAFKLTEKACVGSPCLPADWVKLDGDSVSPDNGRTSRFGYDAIRVLLHLSWDKKPIPDGLKSVLDFYNKEGFIPRWVDLRSKSMSSSSAHAGIYAVYGMAAMRSGATRTGKKLIEEATKKLQSEEREYYSYSLYLLSRIEDPN